MIIILPFLSFFLCACFGRHLGFRVSKFVSTLFIFWTFFVSARVFYKVGFLKNSVYISFGPWIQSDILCVHWSFLFDSLSVTMLFVVTFVSTLVHMYSSSYMDGDPHVPRFMSYLSLFTFFMIILVTADNFLQLFLGWEGVGLCSYLLINFWFTRVQANKAALKALILNRVGDYSLILAIIILFLYFKSLDYGVVFALIPFLVNKSLIIFNTEFLCLDIICFFLLLGAVGKSAQVGLHTWLPDAMEGPTPVSALIHAATMVTAGIFLVIRCSPIFEYSKTILGFVVVFGVITSFFAATIGLVQNDIKKIIAYSTCSQLGYMFFVCGFSQYNVSLFHLYNHAFFKALLFLGAGSVIHALNNEQDIRYMGSLEKFMPVTYVSMLIGSFSLAGFPFLSGFYSKDAILEIALLGYSMSNNFAYWLCTLAALFTAIYSFRLICLVFLFKSNSHRISFLGLHESSYLIIFPLILLSFFSIFSGYLSNEFFMGLGSDFFCDSIFILPENNFLIDIEFLPIIYKNIPTLFSLSGVIFTWLFYHLSFRFYFKVKYKKLLSLYNFLSHKWYFDYLYNFYIGHKFLIFSYNICFKLIDKGFIEILGPTGLSSRIYNLSISIDREQSGYLYQYLCLLFIFILIIFNFQICINF